MDDEDLDRWLDEDDTDGPRPNDPPATPGRPEPVQGRAPWRRMALAGGVVWLVVMAVWLTGRGTGQVTTAAQPDLPPVIVSGSEGLLAPVGMDTVTQPATAAAQPFAEAEATAAPSELAAAAGSWVATATALLRAHLTVPGPVPTYLEWATEVEVRPLGSGVRLVVLDAIWLEGPQGTLDTTRRGRWAIPLADDGQALGGPWPVPTPPDPEPLDLAPPTGDTRRDEIQQVLDETGWGSVQVLASDAHPLLPGVLVALIRLGAEPGDTPSVDEATTVWLTEGNGTLQIMGGPR